MIPYFSPQARAEQFATAMGLAVYGSAGEVIPPSSSFHCGVHTEELLIGDWCSACDLESVGGQA